MNSAGSRAALLAATLIALAAAPAVAQKSKDTLRFPLADGESILDPYLNPGVFNNTWEPSVWDSLLGFDSKNVKFTAQLARGWAQTSPTTYEYELRDDIKWQDGTRFSADDVVYTLNYLIDPKVTLRYKSNWAWLKSIEKLGPYKVRLTSNYPAPDGMMWMTSTSIFPKHLHEPLADKQAFGAKPVGTGPFTITKIDKNTGITAERYTDFKPSPMKVPAGVGKVVAEPVPDAGTLVAKLLRGDIDLARDVPSDQAIALRDTGRFEFTLSPPTLSYSFIGFPSKGAESVKALGDVRVRQAIIRAIDRKAVVQAVYGDVGKDVQPVEGLCDKAQLGCGYTKLVPEYDPAAAKRLLVEAGYPDGFDVTISAATPKESTVVAGMLRAVGIRAGLRMTTLAQRVQFINQGKVEIGYFGWSGGGIFEVSPQLVRHFLSNEYDDPQLVQMAKAANEMMDDAPRRQAVAKLMDYANEQAYLFPMSPIRVIFTHTHEVKLSATDVRAGQINPLEFSWK